MAAQVAPSPAPNPPGPAHLSASASPAIASPSLPNNDTSRPPSSGSRPSAPGNMNVSSPHFPQPPGSTSPPSQPGGFQQALPHHSHPSPSLASPPASQPGVALSTIPSQQAQPPPPSQPATLHQNQMPPPGQLAAVPPVVSPVSSLRTLTDGPLHLTKDYLDLAEMLKRTSGDVVRQAIRDQWEKALLGSQYHIAFLLNATMHQANSETLNRAVHDFGSRMVKESKRHFVKHLSTEDFDEVADLLLQKVSNGFLDKAIARRFETIPARQLVNALARAERLGYDIQDIVEGEEPGAEHVIPSIPNPPVLQSHQHHVSMQYAQPAPPAPRAPPTVHPTQQPQPPMPQNGTSTPVWFPKEPDGMELCNICGWPCSAKAAVEYHQKKSACFKVQPTDRVGRDICPHCGSRFSSSGGLFYHLKTNVCGLYKTEKANRMEQAINNFRAQNPGVMRGISAPEAHPPVHTPSQSNGNHGTPGQGTPKYILQTPLSTSLNDPYANLTPDQRQNFEREMKDAEEHYGRLMREAMKLSEPEQTRQLAALKNRYNTKQSVTRKKYGIRLRERRTKAQVDAERVRMFGPDEEGPATKRAKTSETGAEAPHKRVPTSEMGGLSGSSATAEETDPTQFLTASQPRYQQPPQPSTPGTWNGTPSQSQNLNQGPGPAGTQDDPMSIDDDSDTDSSSDEDIPPTRPSE